MSNLNELFDSLPDYDVFDERNSEIHQRERKAKKRKANNFDYIQYDERRDFRTRQIPQAPPEEYEPEPEHSVDYRDGYGVYRVYEERQKNYATLFFFPIVMIWLEILLRLGCQQSLLTFNMFFVVLFSLSISAVLTTLCTFFKEKFNRVMVNIIVVLLTVWYCAQIVQFNLSGTFLLFSNPSPAPQDLDGFNLIMDTMSDKVYYLLGCFVPFVFNLFAGKYLFPFRRIRIPAKICLLLTAVLLHFTALTVISLDRNTAKPVSNYAVYHQDYDSIIVQEKFGIYTMQTKDISKLFFPD